MSEPRRGIARLFTFPTLAFVCLLAIPIAYFIGGQKGAIGMSLGIVGTAFHLWALWRICVLSGEAAVIGARAKFGAAVAILAFFMKIPVLMVLSNLTEKLGGMAHSCFLSGLGVVYCAMIGWALARR